MKTSSGSITGNILSLGIVLLLWFPAVVQGGTAVAWGDPSQTNLCATGVVAIATGYMQSVLLKSDGTVANCGSHWEQGAVYPITVPAGLSNVVAVAGGHAHSLVLKGDGTVVAWGSNTYGQTNMPADLTNVVAISAADYHSLALKADGTVVTWGGALSYPVPGGLSNVVAIAAGSGNLALKGDGSVVGWGPNANLPNLLSGLSNIVAISSGWSMAGWSDWLALRDDGTVVGYAVPANLTNIAAICASSGTDHHVNLAIKTDGTVVGWGFNFYGGPLVPAGLSNVVAISSDSSHSVALIGGGAPFVMNRLASRTAVMSGKTYFRVEASGAPPFSYQWQFNGTNLPNETGVLLSLTNLLMDQAGNYSVVVSNAFAQVTSDTALLTVQPLVISAQPQPQTNYAGGSGILSVGVQGGGPFYYQWRLNGNDLAGETNSTLVLNDLQLSYNGLISVVVSNSFTTVVSSEVALTVLPMLVTAQPQNAFTFVGGTAGFSVAAQGSQPIQYQWHLNEMALLAMTNSSIVIENAQQNQAGPYSVTLSNIHGGVESADAQLSVVAVAAWGSSGQALAPTNLIAVKAVASGMTHHVALMADGSVTAWGSDFLRTNVPAGLTNVAAIAAGCYAPGTLALNSDGTIVVWGNNGYGPPPASVAALLTNVVAVSGGQSHLLALRADGSIVAWGDNTFGKINVPVGLTNTVAVAAGQNHSLALKADGTVRAWGDNANGRTNVPPGLTNVVAIAAGAAHSLALRGDGVVVVWGGSSFHGQTNVPTDLSNVVAIAAGEFHSLALKADGTVAAWNYNFNGQTNIPTGLSNVVGISAGGRNNLALIGEGPPVLQVPLGTPIWNNGFQVSVPTQSGRVYCLEYTDSLEQPNWKALPLVAGNGSPRTLSDPVAAGNQRFYRVRRW